MQIYCVIAVWRGLFDSIKVFQDAKQATTYKHELKEAAQRQDFEVLLITTELY